MKAALLFILASLLTLTCLGADKPKTEKEQSRPTRSGSSWDDPKPSLHCFEGFGLKGIRINVRTPKKGIDPKPLITLIQSRLKQVGIKVADKAGPYTGSFSLDLQPIAEIGAVSFRFHVRRVMKFETRIPISPRSSRNKPVYHSSWCTVRSFGVIVKEANLRDTIDKTMDTFIAEYLKANPPKFTISPSNRLTSVPKSRLQKSIVETAIRKELKKPTGELTKADYDKVRVLSFSRYLLTELPKEFEKLTQLTHLYLHFNKLTDVTGLEKLTQLQWLILAGNKLTDVSGLEKLTQLKTLHLADNQLTDVKGLEKLTQLTKLYLGDNPALTKAQIDELQKALPNCDIRSNPTRGLQRRQGENR